MERDVSCVLNQVNSTTMVHTLSVRITIDTTNIANDVLAINTTKVSLHYRHVFTANDILHLLHAIHQDGSSCLAYEIKMKTLFCNGQAELRPVQVSKFLN